MVIAALLCAVGIVIPLISPIRILIEPASFTLASHVAIFIAMFISPLTALFVGAGTTLGFFFAGFPIPVVARAASQLVFLTIGSLILSKKPEYIKQPLKTAIFAAFLSVIHGLCEVLVVIPFYFGGNLSALTYEKGFLYSVVLLVGVGTFIHSMLDFYIALYIWKPLQKIRKKA